jgi:hypothetical protein
LEIYRIFPSAKTMFMVVFVFVKIYYNSNSISTYCVHIHYMREIYQIISCRIFYVHCTAYIYLEGVRRCCPYIWRYLFYSILITYLSYFRYACVCFYLKYLYTVDRQNLTLLICTGTKLNTKRTSASCSEPVFVDLLRGPGIDSHPGGPVRNPICRRGPPGYIGWRNRFLGIDAWAP